MSQSETPPHRIPFKVEASRFDLQAGDQVRPGTVIGEDVSTGEPVKAGFHGVVEAIGFDSEDHALSVLVRVEPAPQPRTEEKAMREMAVFRVAASRCDLRAGDRVEPQTAVGQDPASGGIAYAAVYGQVEGVHFVGANHTLVVVIQPDDEQVSINSPDVEAPTR